MRVPLYSGLEVRQSGSGVERDDVGDVDVDVDVSVDVDVEWVDGVEWVPNSGQWKRHFADVPGAPMDRRSDGVDG